MPKVIGTGAITMVDTHDIAAISTQVVASAALQQLYDGVAYTPDRSASPLGLTVKVYKAASGSPILIPPESLTNIRWGSSAGASDLNSGVSGVTAVLNQLTISTNSFVSAYEGGRTVYFSAEYVDPYAGVTQAINTSITLLLSVKGADGAVGGSVDVTSNRSLVFAYNDGISVTPTDIVLTAVTSNIPGATFKWLLDGVEQAEVGHTFIMSLGRFGVLSKSRQVTAVVQGGTNLYQSSVTILRTDTYSVEAGATKGATLGQDFVDDNGTVLSDLALLNKYSNGTQLAGDFTGNPFLVRVDGTYDRPANVKSVWGSNLASQISFSSSARDALLLSGNTVSRGAGWPAFRTQYGMKYRIVLRWRLLDFVSGGAGLSFAVICKDTDIAAGCTHLGMLSAEGGVDTENTYYTSSQTKVVEDTSGVAVGSPIEKVAITGTSPSAWQSTTLEFTPNSSIAWASFAARLSDAVGAQAKLEIDTCYIYSITGTIYADQIAPGAVSNLAIAAGAVTAAKTDIAAIDNSTGNLVAGSVGSSQLLADSVTNLKLAAGAVTAAKTAIAAIDANTGNLANKVVDAAQLVDGAVSAVKLADAAVTAAKLNVAIGGGNLLRNSGFEDATALSGWVIANASGSLVASKDTSIFRSGTSSLKIVQSDSLDNRVYQQIPVKPNTTYTVSAWFYATSINASSVLNRTLSVYDGYSSQSDYSMSTAHALNTWWRKVVKITTNASATYLEVRLYSPNGTVYWDEVQVEAGDVVTAYAPKVNELLTGQVVTGNIADSAITAGQIAANAITASKIAAGVITSSHIASDTITSANIAAGAITASEIAADAVTASHILAGTITSSEIAADAITSTQIAAGAVNTIELAAGAVTASKIAAGTITANEIAAGTITAAKIAAGAVTADNLTIGNFTNLVPNPSFELGNVEWSSLASGVSIVADSTNASSGSYVMKRVSTANDILVSARNGNMFECRAGDKFYLKGLIKSTSDATGTAEWRISWRDKNKAEVGVSVLSWTPGTSYVIKDAIFAAPTGTSFAVIETVSRNQTAGTWYWGEVYLSNAVNTTNIVDGAISTNKVAANAITAAKIAAGTITANEIASGAVTAVKLAADSVTSASILAGAITTTELATGAVTSDKILAGAITADKLTIGTTKFDNLRIKSYGNNMVDKTGGVWLNNVSQGSVSRGTTLWVFNKTTHAFVSKTTYDTFAAVANCDALATALAALTSTSLVLITTADAVSFNSTNDALRTQLQRCGASVLVDGFTAVTQYAYALIGYPTLGEGNGLEMGKSTGASETPCELSTLWMDDTVVGLSGSISTLAPLSSTYIKDGSILTAKIAANAVTASQIAANTITATQIAANTITATQIAANTITGSKIAADTITATNIAAGTITATEIAAGAITTSKIAADAVTAACIAAGTITATEIASGAITGAKIAASQTITSPVINGGTGSFTGTVNANGGTFNNVTINENCDVKGTIYANKIVGDVVAIKPFNLTSPSIKVNKGATVTLFSFNLAPSSKDRYIRLTGTKCPNGGNGILMQVVVSGVQVASASGSVDGLHPVRAGATQILIRAYHNTGSLDSTNVMASFSGEAIVYPAQSGTFV